MKSKKKLASSLFLILTISTKISLAATLDIDIVDPDNTLKTACGIIFGVLTVAAPIYLLVQIMTSGYMIAGSRGNSDKESLGWKAFFSAIKGGLIMFGAWGISGIIYYFANEILYK